VDRKLPNDRQQDVEVEDVWLRALLAQLLQGLFGRGLVQKQENTGGRKLDTHCVLGDGEEANGQENSRNSHLPKKGMF